MKIIDFNTKLDLQPLAVTIGFFDGVHLGHRFLIEQLKEIAKSNGIPSAVITFPESPKQILHPNSKQSLLCSYAEKLKLLETTGVDYCISLNFTTELSLLSAKEFMLQVLKQKLNVTTLLIGYDHHFGHNRFDGFTQYVTYGAQVGIDVVKAEELISPNPISSSKIRKALAEGTIRQANEMLGYLYTISGTVIHGAHVGHTIGFPTANIQISDKQKSIPALGVYAVSVEIGNKIYKGMLYIGKRPTLYTDDELSLEVNIFDFDADIYGETIKVNLIEYVRSDAKFSSLDLLVEQIKKDKLQIQEIFLS